MTSPGAPKKRARPSLETGVERLSASTEGLTAVVDRLTETQARVAQAEAATARLDREAVRQADIQARDRLERRSKIILVSTVLGGLATSLFTVTMLSNAAHGTCERRQETTRAVILAVQADPGPDRRAVAIRAEAVKRLMATLDKTCDEQYPIHF